MRRSEQLRLIYKELRGVLGSDASAADLVRLANVIVRSYSLDNDEQDDDKWVPIDSREFATQEVDAAMRDGGWRILCFERRLAGKLDSIDPIDLTELRFRVDKFLGVEWRQYIQVG